MSALTKTTRNGGGLARSRRDPLSLFSRDFFGWDPFAEMRVARVPAFAPTFEVLENDDAYVLKADVPGVQEADLDISMHQGVLTISGSRNAEEKKEGETYYLYERNYGTFARSFTLPETADADRVDAELAGGVLTVSIAKREQSKPKKIELKR